MDSFKVPSIASQSPLKTAIVEKKTPLKTVNKTETRCNMVTPKSNHIIITSEEKSLVNQIGKNTFLQMKAYSTTKKNMTKKQITEEMIVSTPQANRLAFAKNAKFDPVVPTGVPFLAKRKITVPKTFALSNSARKAPRTITK